MLYEKCVTHRNINCTVNKTNNTWHYFILLPLFIRFFMHYGLPHEVGVAKKNVNLCHMHVIKDFCSLSCLRIKVGVCNFWQHLVVSAQFAIPHLNSFVVTQENTFTSIEDSKWHSFCPFCAWWCTQYINRMAWVRILVQVGFLGLYSIRKTYAILNTAVMKWVAIFECSLT